MDKGHAFGATIARFVGRFGRIVCWHPTRMNIASSFVRMIDIVIPRLENRGVCVTFLSTYRCHQYITRTQLGRPHFLYQGL